MYRNKISGRALSIPLGIAIALFISLVLTLGGAATAAALVSSERIGEGAIGYAAMLTLAVATLIGAWMAVVLIKRLRLQIAMLFGGCYYLLLLATTALLFGGQYQGMGVTAIIVLAASALVAFLPMSNAKTWKKKKSAYR